ncbi:CPBP family glutamic-type intramembrane protease [Desulfospira joergensenii]|uniref:CPBP family glutamic-type intramembrane protease n=1 Tax=Desulfospira joergensenii TaxID=53329 RepID=UPI000487C456|nr:CPBP family glutamic-type intramembrane protease [Desulfospira joergensenii]
MSKMNKTLHTWSNRELIIPYAAPYFAYVGIASLLQDKISVELNYSLKLVIVTALLVWAWRWYIPLTGPRSRRASCLWGVGFGLVGLVLWCGLYRPFAGDGGEAWSFSGFILRMVTASLVVPVFEELMMRGFVFRLALQWDEFRRQKAKTPLLDALEEANINDVSPGAWSVPAVLISTVVFTVGHTVPEWPAAIVYGILMSVLWIMRKDLLSCIVAHGVTNLGLALYVYFTGSWALW